MKSKSMAIILSTLALLIVIGSAYEVTAFSPYSWSSSFNSRIFPKSTPDRGYLSKMPVDGNSVGQIAVWNGTKWVPTVNALLIEAADGYSLGIGDRVFGGFTGATTTGLRNTAFGTLALGSLTSGSSNTMVGYVSGLKITEGIRNAGLGDNTMHELTTGDENLAIGEGSMYWLTTGNENVAIGHGALYYVGSGSNNVGIGESAGFNLRDNDDKNIVIGSYAGYRQTGSNALVIDNQLRASSEVEATNAIIFGAMAAAPEDQDLRLNANVNVNQGLVVVGNINSTSGDICITGGNCLSDIGTNGEDGEDGANGANWYDMTEDEYNCFVGSLILNPGIDIDGNYTSLQECLESLDD